MHLSKSLSIALTQPLHKLTLTTIAKRDLRRSLLISTVIKCGRVVGLEMVNSAAVAPVIYNQSAIRQHTSTNKSAWMGGQLCNRIDYLLCVPDLAASLPNTIKCLQLHTCAWLQMDVILGFINETGFVYFSERGYGKSGEKINLAIRIAGKVYCSAAERM